MGESDRLLTITRDNTWAHLHHGEKDALFGHRDTPLPPGLQYFDDQANEWEALDVDGGRWLLAPVSGKSDPAELERRLRAVLLRHADALVKRPGVDLQGDLAKVEQTSFWELLDLMAKPPFGGGHEPPIVDKESLDFDAPGDRRNALHNWWHSLSRRH